MFRVSWRNLVARKVRLALSAFAIVLGVAFVAGSFIYTDALSSAFNGTIKGTTSDVEVRPTGSGDLNQVGQDSRTVPASVADRLDGIDGAESVSPVARAQGVWVIGDNGKLVGGNGSPGLASNFTEGKAITGDQILSLAEGRLPRGTGQIALDEGTADKAGYQIGDQVTLITPGDPPTRKAELTGLVKFGPESGLAGATLTVFDLPSMQQLFFGGRDVFTSVALDAADGVSQAELAQAAQDVLPPGITAEEGDQVAQDAEDSIADDLSFINTFLLVFAAISVIVGCFLIINTFSILVAQRSRELALLRALGASKRQVNRSVLVEAFAVGVIGSTIGIAVGYLLAIGLKALFTIFGIDLGTAALPLKFRTILVSYLVGVIVTMIAAYLPARHASRIAPVQAMRDDVALPESSLHRRLVFGVCLIVAGVVLMAAGLFTDVFLPLLLIGLGMLAILVGVALMSAVVGRPLVHGLGALYKKAFGTVGTLATENSLRNPRRTAATASALMVGLTLVALMSILGQTAKASTDQIVADSLTADFVVTNSVFGAPFSPAIANHVRKLDGVESVAQFRDGSGKIDDETIYFGAVDPAEMTKAFDVNFYSGGFGQAGGNAILVDKTTAEGQHYQVGDAVDMAMPAGVQKLRVGGVFESSAALPYSYLVDLKTLERGGIKPADTLLYVTTAPGADNALIKDQIDTITTDLPTVTVNDPQEFADTQSAQIDKFLYFIYALLGLAVVIAVLGIINTLALSVIERTREVGLLRAVGVSRRQLRRMVQLESISISVLGAVLGIVMGVAFGVTLQQAISDEGGFSELSIPWMLLTIFVLVSAVVGILAAALPARRAARLNVLAAITTE